MRNPRVERAAICTNDTGTTSFSSGSYRTAFGQPIFAVQMQQVYGCTTLWSQADNIFSIGSEMLRPYLDARIEQGINC